MPDTTPLPGSARGTVFIATSLDGFIARPDGSLDWLENADGQQGEEDFGYADFMATVDGLVMGRRSFDKVLSFGAWPYGALPVYVLSSAPLALPPGLPDSITALGGHTADPAALMAWLGQRGHRRLYIDGGDTIRRFLAAGCIEALTLTRIPVLLGQGIPLFGPTPRDISLTHQETRSYANGFVQSTYRCLPRP
jgi:dihydrofolate reductase